VANSPIFNEGSLGALPITAVLPELRARLREANNVVLQAPPGAGKSTGVPLAVLDESWRDGRKILMLEPRRLAARAVATRMAQLLKERVGATVGYRTRIETKVSSETVIEVITEGILARMLQRDPALEDVALVIFDEFHERSLQADLGLALCLDAQSTLRESLKLLVMSATLDGERIARILGDAPIVSAQGRIFPVTTHWLQPLSSRSSRRDLDIAQLASQATENALEQHTGDVLVFLPGQGEIRRTERLLRERTDLPAGVTIAPLYGDLRPADQDEALRPSAERARKVVLATNIAETSLTIEGIGVVIDSGLVRRARFNPATGMSRLETSRISRASAEQRTGRAGRLGPGVCYRLWTEAEHASLLPHTAPEIIDADLAPLALELAQWGIVDPAALKWLDAPPSATFAQARDLLRQLEAIGADGRITETGRAMNALGTHPRLAHMIVRAKTIGATGSALEIAALLGERDILRFEPRHEDADLRPRVSALRTGRAPARAHVDMGTRERVLRDVTQLQRQLGGERTSGGDDEDVGRLLALAYPDRIGMSRGEGGRYLLVNGRGAALTGPQSLGRSEFLVICDLDEGDREARVHLAAPIARESLEELFTRSIVAKDRIEWNGRELAVVTQRERWLGAICLEERRIDRPDTGLVLAALLTGIREIGLARLPWSREALALRDRLRFVRAHDNAATWPDVSDEHLLATLETWLGPWLDGRSRLEHLSSLDLHDVLLSLLSWDERKRLDELAPTHLTVPSGSRIPIDYSTDTPTLAVRLQEVFGLTETPRVAAGKVPLTLHLLSPARRPVQVTRDLESFWRRGYVDVKKELKGRYPKHYWPDDPLAAQATARAKPRPS
jgi:ATP-dependent helicase HrpB